MRWFRIIGVTLLLMGGHAVWGQDRPPDGRVEFSSTSYGLLLGVNRGEGRLIVKDRQYFFTVSGIKLATLGIARINAIGQVYHLRDLADFSGRYYAVEGAFTIVQGGGNALLRNSKGVMLYLQNVQQGLELTLGGGGFDIVFVEPTTEKAAGYQTESR